MVPTLHNLTAASFATKSQACSNQGRSSLACSTQGHVYTPPVGRFRVSGIGFLLSKGTTLNEQTGQKGPRP